MKRAVTLLGATLLVATFFSLSVAPGAVGSGTTFSFNLVGPNTAKATSGFLAGHTIRVTGSGTFNTGTRSIVASGSETDFAPDGSVFSRGTWEATAFNSFTGFGGPNPGTQGGVLHLTITIFPEGKPPATGRPMSVTCAVFAPPGTEEGVTFGAFTEKTGGTTLFHLN